MTSPAAETVTPAPKAAAEVYLWQALVMAMERYQKKEGKMDKEYHSKLEDEITAEEMLVWYQAVNDAVAVLCDLGMQHTADELEKVLNVMGIKLGYD